MLKRKQTVDKDVPCWFREEWNLVRNLWVKEAIFWIQHYWICRLKQCIYCLILTISRDHQCSLYSHTFFGVISLSCFSSYSNSLDCFFLYFELQCFDNIVFFSMPQFFLYLRASFSFGEFLLKLAFWTGMIQSFLSKFRINDIF